MILETNSTVRRAAAVDIGSNSCRLLIGQKQEGKIVRERYEMETTRLAEGVDRSDRIKKEAAGRTRAVLRRFAEIISEAQVERVAAAGTSALRRAENGEKFRREFADILGGALRIVSGRDEARLVLAGVKSYCGRNVDAVIDIGGGSTEIIFSSIPPDKFEYFSFELGAVSMTENFISDPAAAIDRSVLAEIKNETAARIKKPEIADFFSRGAENSGRNILDFYGAGGTITTLAAISQNLAEYRPEKVEEYELDSSELEKITLELASRPIDERKKVLGLKPERADIIVAGAAILTGVLDELELSGLKVSDRGILFGLLEQAFSGRV